MNLKKIVPMALLLFWSSTFLAQQEAKHSEEHKFKNFRVAFEIGHGLIPSANPNGKNFLIIPTLGLELQYWFNKKWGIALKNDLEISNYVVEDKADKNKFVERENPLIVAIPLLISPWNNGLTFLAGPGIELEEHENFSVFRMGVGYEFEYGNHWDFSPEFVYDLKNSHINSFTIAFGVGKRF